MIYLRSADLTTMVHVCIYHPLDRWERMNVEMDTAAKERWARSASTHRPFHGVEGELWPVRLLEQGQTSPQAGEKVVNDLASRLADHVLGAPLEAYWVSKGLIRPDAVKTVNWSALSLARETPALARRFWVSKFASNHCAVGTRLHQRQLTDSPSCPRGCPEEETSQHVLSCPNGNDLWDSLASILLQWGRKNKAAPGLMEALITGISHWRDGTAEHAPLRYWPSDLRTAYESQTAQGWGGVLFGFTSTAWERFQSSHFKAIRSRRSSRRWVAALIRKLWDVSWDLWNYRCYQLNKESDPEAEQALRALSTCISVACARRTSLYPAPFRPMLQRPLHQILSSSYDDRILWLETVDNAFSLRVPQPRGSFARHVINRLTQGGLLQRLQRRKEPPKLRTTHRVIQTSLLSMDREED